MKDLRVCVFKCKWSWEFFFYAFSLSKHKSWNVGFFQHFSHVPIIWEFSNSRQYLLDSLSFLWSTTLSLSLYTPVPSSEPKVVNPVGVFLLVVLNSVWITLSHKRFSISLELNGVRVWWEPYLSHGISGGSELRSHAAFFLSYFLSLPLFFTLFSFSKPEAGWFFPFQALVRRLPEMRKQSVSPQSSAVSAL